MSSGATICLRQRGENPLRRSVSRPWKTKSTFGIKFRRHEPVGPSKSESLGLIEHRIAELDPSSPRTSEPATPKNTGYDGSVDQNNLSIRELLKQFATDELEFQVEVEPRTAADIRALLEELIRLVTDLVQDGAFKNSPYLEERVGRDRDTIHYELFENPDGMAPAILVPTVQRVVSTILPVLDEAPGKALLGSMAAEPDRDPQGPEAANKAISKAQTIADEIDSTSDVLPPNASPSRWLAGTLRWIEPTVEGAGLGTGVAGTLIALGVGGPVAIALGAVLGLLTFFRPKAEIQTMLIEANKRGARRDNRVAVGDGRPR